MFTCTATGLPRPSFQWTRTIGNTQVTLTNSSQLVISETNAGDRQITSVLTLAQTSTSNTANYTCTAQNTAGSDSSTASLNVYGESLNFFNDSSMSLNFFSDSPNILIYEYLHQCGGFSSCVPVHSHWCPHSQYYLDQEWGHTFIHQWSSNHSWFTQPTATLIWCVSGDTDTHHHQHCW